MPIAVHQHVLSVRIYCIYCITIHNCGLFQVLVTVIVLSSIQIPLQFTAGLSHLPYIIYKNTCQSNSEDRNIIKCADDLVVRQPTRTVWNKITGLWRSLSSCSM